MFVSLIRAIILYLIVMCAIKFMGKRQIGELEPSELVITFLISDIAAIPMQNSSQPLISGLIPIGVLVCLEILVSNIMIKNPHFRKLTCGQSVIVINNGTVNQKELNRMRVNIYDLYEQLRQMNVFSIDDVAYAIMESNGKLSVLKKSKKQPPDSSLLNLNPPESTVDFIVISNGKVNEYNLKLCNLNKEWLYNTIKNKNTKIDDIFMMSANINKKFKIVKKDNNE